ncbi:MAG: hypothetical protein C5B56_10985 [Proteobacteria bacterium]|nr:MAG: hypothetical protein C5B56_10985 [Pseudomonadota bacterium]
MELWLEDMVMQAFASISGQDCRGARPFAIEHADSWAWQRRSKPSHECPGCDLPASKPLTSAAEAGGVIVHQWQCEACETEWVSSFRPLLV